MMNKLENVKKQAEELVAKMTIEEVCTQLRFNSDGIERLGIPEYNWWNEALHGVARAGVATVFPQAIGLAAMFDDEFLTQIADVISTEARAKYNEQSELGDRDIYKGLTLWSPNINIFRDPRWGRGHETYGEDPYLTSRLGVAFIKGLQGVENYPEVRTLKTAACAKHFAVHSGPEAERHHFDAKASAKDMEETYLPAFKAAVTEGKVESVMGAYNRLNSEACCGSYHMITEVLRNKWGFEGHFVSDCWAILDFHEHHQITNTPAESAALALNSGCDLNCGTTYLCLLAALKEKKITEKALRQAAVRLMMTRMKLGIISSDDEEINAKKEKYDSIGYLENDSPEHNKMALEAARRSIVMLKNNGVLPLDEKSVKVIGVVGPTADSRTVLEGNYNGTSSEYITNLLGIKQRSKSRIIYSEGAHLYNDRMSNLAKADDRLAEALAVVRNSDVTILCMGLDSTIEGEEGDTGNMFASGDKISLAFPESQEKLCRRVFEEAEKLGKKVICVINAGSCMDLSFIKEHADAILNCWYSGGQGGRALAEVLFGDVNPSGRLPVTFYKEGELPEFTDYSMKNRTYRYYKGEPVYPFGYGLSYTEFEYSEPEIQSELKENDNYVSVAVSVKNIGAMDGEEVVLLYIDKHPSEKKHDKLNPDNQPVKSLCGFKRINVKKGQTTKVIFEVPEESFTTVLEDGERKLLGGRYTLMTPGGNVDIEV